MQYIRDVCAQTDNVVLLLDYDNTLTSQHISSMIGFPYLNAHQSLKGVEACLDPHSLVPAATLRALFPPKWWHPPESVPAGPPGPSGPRRSNSCSLASSYAPQGYAPQGYGPPGYAPPGYPHAPPPGQPPGPPPHHFGMAPGRGRAAPVQHPQHMHHVHPAGYGMPYAAAPTYLYQQPPAPQGYVPQMPHALAPTYVGAATI